MDIIQLKIKNEGSIAKYIKIIREFDASLSMSDIKRKIETGDFAVEFDLEYYDTLEDLNGVDKKKIFRGLIGKLTEVGAEVSVYHNGELSSVELLDNWLGSLDEISRQTETDIEERLDLTMNTIDIKSVIAEKLAEIENAEDVRILHCIESGSRAWGFASPDSDYDVRFIYVRRPEFYLKLGKTSDVIEWQLDDVLDINGWDIQKALRLLYKSNMALFEWNASPIVYKTTREWSSVREIMSRYFNVKMGLYHYLNMAVRNYREYLTADEVKLKKYFYALRPILACRWIIDNKTPPPVPFSELVESELERDMRPIVDRLTELKKQTSEIGIGHRIDAINSYIENNIKEIQKNIEILKTERNNWEELDKLFCEIVGI